GRLGEGPAQVRVADLLTAAAQHLARRLVPTADQPAVGQELAFGRKAADVVDLVEQDQGQDLADPGDAAQAGEGRQCVRFGGRCQVQFQGADVPLEHVDEGQVHGGALLDAGVGKAAGDVHLLAVAGVGEALGEGRQVVLAVEDLQVGDQGGPLADQVSAAAE